MSGIQANLKNGPHDGKNVECGNVGVVYVDAELHETNWDGERNEWRVGSFGWSLFPAKFPVSVYALAKTGYAWEYVHVGDIYANPEKEKVV